MAEKQNRASFKKKLHDDKRRLNDFMPKKSASAPNLSASAPSVYEGDEDFVIKTVAGNPVADLRARAEYQADSAGAKMRETREGQKSKNPNDDCEELGGPKGLEPTRYGDWERAGRCFDF